MGKFLLPCGHETNDIALKVIPVELEYIINSSPGSREVYVRFVGRHPKVEDYELYPKNVFSSSNENKFIICPVCEKEIYNLKDVKVIDNCKWCEGTIDIIEDTDYTVCKKCKEMFK